MNYSFKTVIWIYGGEGAWHFATVPSEISSEIKEISAPIKRSFGSVKIIANIGKSTWQTSLFPDGKTGCYILPIKKSIRLVENLEANKLASIKISLSLS